MHSQICGRLVRSACVLVLLLVTGFYQVCVRACQGSPKKPTGWETEASWGTLFSTVMHFLFCYYLHHYIAGEWWVRRRLHPFLPHADTLPVTCKQAHTSIPPIGAWRPCTYMIHTLGAPLHRDLFVWRQSASLIHTLVFGF